MNHRALVPEVHIPDNISYPTVPPVPNGTPRPQWSVMIPTYNRPNYLRQTIQSVLDQALDSDDMQIAVVDNASTIADIQALVEEVGQGRVEYHRHESNIGIINNWNSCLRLARGHWVYILHDDDFVLPGFFQACQEHIARYGCNIIMSQAIIATETGVWHGVSRPVPTKDGKAVDKFDILFQNDTFAIDTLVATRSAYETVGGYLNEKYGTDDELCARLFQTGSVGFLSRPYVAYRSHPGQISLDYYRNPNLIHDALFMFELVLKHNPTLPRERVYRFLSNSLSSISNGMRYQGYWGIAFRQAIWAYRLTPSWEYLRKLIDLAVARVVSGLRAALGRFRRPLKLWMSAQS